MKQIRNYTSFISFAQEANDVEVADEPEQSNIQQYTPSKLLGIGQWDVKWFNNLFVSNRAANADVPKKLPRQSFLTTTFQVYKGVGKNKRVNLGLITRVRSNVISNQNDEKRRFRCS